MYAYFKGKIIERNLANNILILDVADVGYQIETSTKTLLKLNPGEVYTIQIVAQTNDEGVRLFGFINKVEKELFQMLIKVSGIGPKSAINILNSFEVEQFISAVIRGDSKLIEEAQGVGSKTAQRIILELKNKFKNINYQNPSEENNIYKYQEEVSSVLNNLGLSYLEIDKKLTEAREKSIPDDAEMLIRYCLSN